MDNDRRSDSPAEAIAELVAELIDEVTTRAPITRYWQVNRGGGRTATTVELAHHHTRLPGLLDQLHAIQAAARTIRVGVYRETDDGQRIHVRTEERPAAAYGVITAGAAVPSGSPGWDADGALSPTASGGSFESAPPATAALDLLMDIRAGVAELRVELRAATGRPPALRTTSRHALREIVGLALDADDDTAYAALRRLRAWVSSAKVLLGYEAPIVTLRDIYCPCCGGPMQVRADASSAVWCSGRLPIHGPALDGEPMPIGFAPCGAKWPRGSWVQLLEEMEARTA